MPSGPSLFDDAGDPTGGDHLADAPEPPAHSGEPTRRSPTGRPNYLIRRAVVVGGVVAVLATASVVIGQLMGSGAIDTSSGAVPADWNRVALLDERSGLVTVTDERGEEIGRIESGAAGATDAGVVEHSMLIASPDVVAVLDLDRASDEPASEPVTSDSPSADSVPTDGAGGDADGGATSAFAFGAERVTTPTGSALTLIASRSDGGRAVLLHGPSGDVIDTDSFAPVVGARYESASAQATASGRDVLVTDSGNFQSVLISFDRDEPSFFSGLGLAVDDDIVVTAQNVGPAATISVFDHSGEQLTTGRTDSVRAGMIVDDRVILITVDGLVVTLDTETGDTDEGEQLDIGTVESGDVTTSGDRLVVSGTAGTAVVGDDAGTVGTYPEAGLTDDGHPPTGSQCVTLATLGDDSEPDLTVVDLADGSIVADASASAPTYADASGCTIAVTTSSGFDLITPDGSEPVQTSDTLVALAPDASTVVLAGAGRLTMVDALATDPPMPPIDLGRQGRAVFFTRS